MSAMLRIVEATDCGYVERVSIWVATILWCSVEVASSISDWVTKKNVMEDGRQTDQLSDEEKRHLVAVVAARGVW
jgi:hypothetical protein